VWSDGTPFTSADSKFTYEYCTHPEGGCAQVTKFEGVLSVETPDDLTVVVNFRRPDAEPLWSLRRPRARSSRPRSSPTALAPARPNAPRRTSTRSAPAPSSSPNSAQRRDHHGRERELPRGRQTGLCHRDLQGRRRRTAAGRAVMETGEFDYAWNLQLAPDVIAEMEAEAARAPRSPASARWSSASCSTTPTPIRRWRRALHRERPVRIRSSANPAVYKAMSMAIDRPLLVESAMARRQGRPATGCPAPEILNSDTFACSTQDIEGANALLDEAGYRRHRRRRRPRVRTACRCRSSTRPPPTPSVRTSRR
jgi:peptide/nickel transport system substrate-binding protein